jgi:hypothetical protein
MEVSIDGGIFTIRCHAINSNACVKFAISSVAYGSLYVLCKSGRARAIPAFDRSVSAGHERSKEKRMRWNRAMTGAALIALVTKCGHHEPLGNSAWIVDNLNFLRRTTDSLWNQT